MYEIHLFAATARATDGNLGPYLSGEKHALLIMSRQATGTDHDWEAAEKNASKSGWAEFEFQRAGTLAAENMNGRDIEFVEAFEHAMFGGCSVIAYRDPIVDDSLSLVAKLARQSNTSIPGQNPDVFIGTRLLKFLLG